jgi:Cys-tRNA(Pro)/Cys-tRNA(Cys) deacylase
MINFTIETKITRLLRAEGVAFRLLPHSEPVYTVEAAAAQRGVVRQEMVKSILLRDRAGRYAMACLPGDARLDPQAVRAHLAARDGAEWKRLTFATAEEVLAVTGSVEGAVAPLALPPDVPVVFDESVAGLPKVNISTGDPMAGLEMATADLIRLARGTLGVIRR